MYIWTERRFGRPGRVPSSVGADSSLWVVIFVDLRLLLLLLGVPHHIWRLIKLIFFVREDRLHLISLQARTKRRRPRRQRRIPGELHHHHPALLMVFRANDLQKKRENEDNGMESHSQKNFLITFSAKEHLLPARRRRQRSWTMQKGSFM